MIDLYQISTFILPILIAVTLHEAAHGYAALRYGDDTAKQAGRLSLNPLRHVDGFGTILLPGMLALANSPVVLGYAKPVPVRFDRLNNPRRDMMLVAMAGPGMNIALLILSALLINLLPFLPSEAAKWLLLNLQFSIVINAVLAVFNMLPVPPLDGSKVMAGLLPPALGKRYVALERYGILIVLGILLLPHLIDSLTGYWIPLAEYLISRPALWVAQQLANLFIFL
jgi:Zn-dependent protease